MKIFLTIFKKEFTDTIRDRRTLIVMLVIPLLLFPIMITIVTKLSMSTRKKAEEKTLKVALIANGNAADLRTALMARSDIYVREDVPADSAQSFIQQETVDAAIVVAADFDRQVGSNQPGSMKFFYKSSDEFNISKRRLDDLLKKFEQQLLAARLTKLKLDQAVMKTLDVQQQDIASMKEKLGKTVGGFLPYIFVIFCYLGTIYPAIDLGAGEKERGTMETLLTTPVSRMQIMLGKFAVVVLAGLLSAAMGIFGLYTAVRQAVDIPPEFLNAIMGILEAKSIILVLSLMFPLTVFFASMLLSISIYAKSFKEAQSMIVPAQFVVIMPVAIGLFPGIQLNNLTALIPVLNVSLATKEIIAGTVKTVPLLEAYAVLFLIAGLGLYGCSRWFEREETIFRGV